MLDRMTDAMIHRGPNDRGTYVSEGIGLGVRRLSIVDVAGGHQPIASEDGQVWAVQNGELYNHLDLRAELIKAGHTFRTRCDTEVLPHLYERFGKGFPEHLRGKFAVALWDERRRELFLARDRLGVKPLYWVRLDDRVLFASELKSLLASGLVPTELDFEAIDAYLALGFFPGPSTPLKAVSKLLPGERLIVSEREVRSERYWRYPVPLQTHDRRPTEWYAKALMEELEEAVQLRLMSDVPVGAMLSGGIDSSLVVAMMSRAASAPVKTFSVGFAEAGDQNELSDAREVANLYGTDHHELELSFADASIDVADLVWHLDEPLNDLSALGFLALSEVAARDVTVALSGQGADELLGGYRRYRTASLLARWAALPGPLQHVGQSLLGHGGSRLQRLGRVLAADQPAQRFVISRDLLENGLRSSLVRGPLAELDGSSPLRPIERALRGFRGSALETSLYLDGQLGLVDDMLHYFDRASMAHSLEVRVPFLDHHVVEFCATIPSELKVRGLTTKYLLKRAARGLVPDRIIDKPKVGFFNALVDHWMHTQGQSAISDYLLQPRPAFADFIDQRVVEELIAGQGRRPGSNGRLLLSLLMLEVWLASCLPRALAAARVDSRSEVSLRP